GKTELMRGRKRCVVGEKRSPGRVRIQDEFQPRLPVNMRGMALRVPSNRDVSASARIQEAPAVCEPGLSRRRVCSFLGRKTKPKPNQGVRPNPGCPANSL